MSGISYSHDVDSQLHNRNPNSTNSHEVELPPFPQNFPSPICFENQLFFDTMPADHQTQQTNLEPIWNEPLPRVNIANMNTANGISTNVSTGEIHLHSEVSDHYLKMKKSTSSRGSTARKSGKKDRHSKINTAQGVRDRRMRLSLQIARQFFDLQDALGFDKASKTIDWLFSASRKAIKQLDCSSSHCSQMNNNRSRQNGSKGEENSEQKRKIDIATSEGEGGIGLKTAEILVASGNAKVSVKELRNKARARARERTREKKMIRGLEKSNYKICGEAYNLAQLGPADQNPNLISQELMSNPSSQDTTWTSQSSFHCQLANMALLGVTASSSGSVACSMFDYNEKNDLFTGGSLDSFCNNLFNTGNWDITSEYLNPNSINFQENRGYHF